MKYDKITKDCKKKAKCDEDKLMECVKKGKVCNEKNRKMC